MDDPTSVTLYLNSSDIPGVSDAGSILELHAKHILIYGMCHFAYSIVRVDPEKKTADIEVLKTRKKQPFLPREWDEALTVKIEDDFTPEHWERILKLPEEPDDEPALSFQFELQGREWSFYDAMLDLHGIRIPLSNPNPLIRFFRNELEDRANEKCAKHPCEFPPGQ
jgi:hypothetical protein